MNRANGATGVGNLETVKERKMAKLRLGCNLKALISLQQLVRMAYNSRYKTIINDTELFRTM